MATAERYRLHAYVEAGGVLRKHWRFAGRMTFKGIYQSRPDGCRYAVVSIWDREAHDRYFAVFDLFDVLKTADNELVTPEPRWTHVDLNSAIMTTVLMYGDPRDVSSRTASCNNV